jgi:hypothetical protein
MLAWKTITETITETITARKEIIPDKKTHEHKVIDHVLEVIASRD